MMRQHPGATSDLPVRHHFAPGLYGRELFIPRDTLLTGKIHKFTHLSILLQGDISVLVDGQIRRIRAPFVYVSPPGTKRIAYTHSDTLWLTVHGLGFSVETGSDGMSELEKFLTAETEEDYRAHEQSLLE